MNVSENEVKVISNIVTTNPIAFDIIPYSRFRLTYRQQKLLRVKQFFWAEKRWLWWNITHLLFLAITRRQNDFYCWYTTHLHLVYFFTYRYSLWCNGGEITMNRTFSFFCSIYTTKEWKILFTTNINCLANYISSWKFVTHIGVETADLEVMRKILRSHPRKSKQYAFMH